MRPKSANIEKSKLVVKILEKKSEPVVETKKFINVPFAENRLKGQFESITKDLNKRAQDVIHDKKVEEQRKKEEQAFKKDRQRAIDEQIKRDN